MKLEKNKIGPLFQERKFDKLMAMYRLDASLFNTELKRFLFDSAVRRADTTALQFVLDLGYDINEVSYTGTPLSRAAYDGNIKIIQCLIKMGAKLDESSISTNPLFSAIQGGKPEVVRFFLTQGIDSKKRYPCGRDALDFARTWNDQDVISELGGDPLWKRSPWVLCNIPDLTGQKPSAEMVCAVEAELNFLVPSVLKTFLINDFPSRLFFPKTKDSDDWEWLGMDHQLFHTARSLIAYNATDPEKVKKERKHQAYIVFGTDGGGNDYCLSTSSDDDRVWIYDHETKEFSCTNLSLKNFSARLSIE